MIHVACVCAGVDGMCYQSTSAVSWIWGTASASAGGEARLRLVSSRERQVEAKPLNSSRTRVRTQNHELRRPPRPTARHPPPPCVVGKCLLHTSIIEQVVAVRWWLLRPSATKAIFHSPYYRTTREQGEAEGRIAHVVVRKARTRYHLFLLLLLCE